MTTAARGSGLDRTTYYILEPVREALILGQRSPELKTSARGKVLAARGSGLDRPSLSVGHVLLRAVAVPCYGRLAARLSRRALLNTFEATS